MSYKRTQSLDPILHSKDCIDIFIECWSRLILNSRPLASNTGRDSSKLSVLDSHLRQNLDFPLGLHRLRDTKIWSTLVSFNTTDHVFICFTYLTFLELNRTPAL